MYGISLDLSSLLNRNPGERNLSIMNRTYPRQISNKTNSPWNNFRNKLNNVLNKLAIAYCVFMLCSLPLSCFTGYIESHSRPFKYELEKLFKSYRYAIFLYERDNGDLPPCIDVLYDKGYLKRNFDKKKLPNLSIEYSRFDRLFMLECSVEYYIKHYSFKYKYRNSDKFKEAIKWAGESRKIEDLEYSPDDGMIIYLSENTTPKELQIIQLLIVKANKNLKGYSMSCKTGYHSPYLGESCREYKQKKIYTKRLPIKR